LWSAYSGIRQEAVRHSTQAQKRENNVSSRSFYFCGNCLHYSVEDIYMDGTIARPFSVVHNVECRRPTVRALFNRLKRANLIPNGLTQREFETGTEIEFSGDAIEELDWLLGEEGLISLLRPAPEEVLAAGTVANPFAAFAA
jgi:hypothetical protein